VQPLYALDSSNRSILSSVNKARKPSLGVLSTSGIRIIEIVRLKKPIELVVTVGVIFRAHEGVKEFRGGLAGFLHGGAGIARDEDECVVATHRNTVLPSPLAPWGRLGAQPQRDVSGLLRLPHYPHEVLTQRLQVRLFSQLDGRRIRGSAWRRTSSCRSAYL
jgi:hypothetical protein